jgi:hypothetical protein
MHVMWSVDLDESGPEDSGSESGEDTHTQPCSDAHRR